MGIAWRWEDVARQNQSGDLSCSGPNNSINQSVLPVAIIIINAPDGGCEKYTSDNVNVATEDFFAEIDLEENNILRERAQEVLQRLSKPRSFDT